MKFLNDPSFPTNKPVTAKSPDLQKLRVAVDTCDLTEVNIGINAGDRS